MTSGGPRTAAPCRAATPLSAPCGAAQASAVELLLESRADPNVVCCASTSSGAYNFWTALDCARTGDVLLAASESCLLRPREHSGPTGECG